ncbi:MAG: PDZ domain-containing protein [Proteobacteria bacterium]|nr:MAG: PDZ domain-containing protein [Pseudomonadota bacterium]
MKTFFRKPLPVLLFCSALGVGGCFFNNDSSQAAAPATVTTPTPKPTAQAISDLKREVPLDISKLGDPLPRNLWVELSKLVNPAVVSITTTSAPRQSRAQMRDPIQDFFEEFYGGRSPGGPRGGGPDPRSQQAMALGTGFIIRDDGLIITNNHVVEAADIIKVQLDNTSGKLYEAEVIGRDPQTDLALIKIDAKMKLPVAKLGESKSVQVGEYVAAFGNPYGHAHTMTTGIVSALGREIAEINRFPFIQTDASINPGNSGGPLVNTQGFVIGVNTAIDARAQGIGFAIPIDNVKQIVDQLEKSGRVRRGFIGVGIATVDEDVAAQLGLPGDTKGVAITQVQRGGPADKGGLRPYDVILEFGGQPTVDASALSRAVGDTPIGSTAKVKYWRVEENGKRRELTSNITIGENADDTRKAAAPSKQFFGQKAPFDLGFKVADYSTAIAKEFNLPADGPQGPVVTEVERGGAASRSGLSAGDVIMDINRSSVAKSTDVLKRLKKGRNLIRIARGNSVAIVSVGN